MSNQKLCFLIDNDEDDREIFCMALKEIDPAIKCTTSASGVEALEYLSQHKEYVPHFIFMDMNMPMMHGMECLKELKKMPHLQHIPVYMYSTSADPKSVEKVNELGAADFLIKPISYAGLIHLLTRLLETHSALS